ncbi:uncharacterized protein LOC115995809 isoform X1 [Ipomoea triloba]|uniref:uncharacterized protein LOC115995809 isoform X1 n=1 Tax=Ipomoea triloba TaxID=35885 RepID=UPI00125D22B4|nr:uncharacterized protein LOC115995809 isoform X1 [Ipomoea triloba]
MTTENDIELPKKPRSPVELNHCIEELLRHTLAFAVAGTLDTDIGLSDDFCANLLHDDTSNSTVPLYKRLAASLYQCISSGDILRTDSEVAVMHESCSLKQKEDGCNYKLVREKGSELINVLKTVDFELHVQEPFFSHLRSGEKTIEGRCALGDYNKIEVGASILFNKCLVLQVQDVHRYASFREMLEAEPLSKVLPGIKSTEGGVQVYRNFYSEEKERSNGVLAICVTKPVSQPYLSMASIISVRFKLWRSSQPSKLCTELGMHLILPSSVCFLEKNN